MGLNDQFNSFTTIINQIIAVATLPRMRLKYCSREISGRSLAHLVLIIEMVKIYAPHAEIFIKELTVIATR